MRAIPILFLLLIIVINPGVTAELKCPATEEGMAGCSRDSFYCQAADYDMIYNMSSGFDAEFADDIPVILEGRYIEQVTLWTGEWFYGGGPYWRDPVGFRVNFYHESCPPELDPFLSIETAWADLDKTIVVDTSSKKLYEIRVEVSPPLQITEGMSLGATILIDWGSDEPFAGICATPMYVSYGACVAYFDAMNWGYTRWTAIDEFTNIPQDLAYCLDGGATDVETPAAGLATLTNHPNPFNPRTRIHFSTAMAGTVRLSIFDVNGRLITRLLDERLTAGEHQVDWLARDGSGRALPSGVYLARLLSAAGTKTLRLVLLQ